MLESEAPGFEVHRQSRQRVIHGSHHSEEDAPLGLRDFCGYLGGLCGVCLLLGPAACMLDPDDGGLSWTGDNSL